MSFNKLVRYESEGSISYGDLIESDEGGFKVRKLSGDVPSGFQAQSAIVTVKKLLCPLESTPIIICVGINYRKHANEASVSACSYPDHASTHCSSHEVREPFADQSLMERMAQLEIPEYPVIFTKPPDALAGPNESIPICVDAQSMLDYEGELTLVVARDCKNLPKDFDLGEIVLGYTAGNDVSARNFQLPKTGGGQYCYAKSFDRFAPIGPYIASSKIIQNPQALKYVTRVNGEVVQETGTDDMIWSVKDILRHLTRGTTLRAGTVIMTGTPAGVGIFRNKFLKDGDTVEVDIEGTITLSNTISYE